MNTAVEDAPTSVQENTAKVISSRGIVVAAWAITLCAVYSLLSTASRGFCPGGVTGSGGYLDGEGEPTTSVPECINLVLQPNTWVYFGIAAIALGGMFVANRFAKTPEHAKQLLAVTLIAMVSVAILTLALSYVWFFEYPILDWRPGSAVSFPFPLDVHIDTTRMQ